jgi:uncharacterized HAD superfamily protein
MFDGGGMAHFSRRRIGIDVDDTLVAFSRGFTAFLRERGYEIDLELSHTWEMQELLGMTKKEFLYLADQFAQSPYHYRMQPVAGAKHAIQRLARQHELYAVSARPGRFVAEVTELIHRHYGPRTFSGIDLLGHMHDKGEHCVRLGIHDLIDDGAHNILAAHRVGVKAILFDRPWNATLPHHADIIRAKSWSEILSLYGM